MFWLKCLLVWGYSPGGPKNIIHPTQQEKTHSAFPSPRGLLMEWVWKGCFISLLQTLYINAGCEDEHQPAQQLRPVSAGHQRDLRGLPLPVQPALPLRPGAQLPGRLDLLQQGSQFHCRRHGRPCLLCKELSAVQRRHLCSVQQAGRLFHTWRCSMVFLWAYCTDLWPVIYLNSIGPYPYMSTSQTHKVFKHIFVSL